MTLDGRPKGQKKFWKAILMGTLYVLLILLIGLLTWYAKDMNTQQSPLEYCNDSAMTNNAIVDLFQRERNFSITLWNKIKNYNDDGMAPVSWFLGISQLVYGTTGETRQELCDYLGVECSNLLQYQNAFRHLVDIIKSIISDDITMGFRIFYQSDLKPIKPLFGNILSKTFHEEPQELGGRNIANWYDDTGIYYTEDLRKIEYSKQPILVVAGGGYVNIFPTSNFSLCRKKIWFKGDYDDASKTNVAQYTGEFNYGELETSRFVEIPWQLTDETKINISTLIILPKKDYNLDDVEHGLDEKTVNRALFQRQRKRNVRITLPDFYDIVTYRTHDEFMDWEYKLGLSKTFGKPSDKFSGITDTSSTRVSAIVHKCTILNTRAFPYHPRCKWRPLPASSNQNDTVEFTANRPFMMIVATKSEPSLILFIAHYTGEVSEYS